MSPALRDDARPRGVDQFEHERVGIHNEAQTVRRERIRCGPIRAGIVAAVGSYLFLQPALVATGIGELGDSADDGVLHGIVMWFAALVAIIVLSAIGSGVALGSFDTTDEFTLVDVDPANDEAQDAAGKALLAFTLGLAAAAAGGPLGAKMWPKDDAFVVVVKRENTQ